MGKMFRAYLVIWCMGFTFNLLGANEFDIEAQDFSYYVEKCDKKNTNYRFINRSICTLVNLLKGQYKNENFLRQKFSDRFKTNKSRLLGERMSNFWQAEEELAIGPWIQGRFGEADGHLDRVNLKPLQKISGSIKKLKLSNLDIELSEYIGKFKNLKELEISSSKIPDFKFLSDLTSLERLVINRSNVSDEDLKFIADLKNLESLELEENSIKDLSNLNNFKKDGGLLNLKSLMLPRNQIESVEVLKYFLKLTELSLWSNNITLTDSLSNLENLEKLKLMDNKIENVDALAGCKILEELNLNHNKIRDIESLISSRRSSRTPLKIYVDENRIEPDRVERIAAAIADDSSLVEVFGLKNQKLDYDAKLHVRELDDTECPLCLDPHSEYISCNKDFKHFYCRECIQKWASLTKKRTDMVKCPTCRCNIGSEENVTKFCKSIKGKPQN